jgi:sporulation protein YlmC with PRC-barrel domain
MAGRLAVAFGLILLAAGSTAPARAQPSPSPSPASTEGTSALVVNDAGAQTLLGMPVQTSKGEDLGRVVDVVVDRHGDLMAAIIDFGGFLGVGTRKIAIDWRMLHFPQSDGLNKLIADLSHDELRNAPAYKANEPIVIMGAPAPKPTVSAAPDPSAAKP